jgi:lipopolysaccharide transport system ATP-binding protein
MGVVLHAENISKLFRLGNVGTSTLSEDIRSIYYRLRGKDNPFLVSAETNDRQNSAKGSDYVWALKDVHFEVNQGDILGIVGRNGAGKSTLLKILSRTTAPTKGEIRIKGKVASLLEVGTGFHPDLTGRENIYLNGAILGMRKAEIKANLDAIIEFAGVQRYVDTPVKRYSSGMYIRLAFAVAAHLDPDILIIDEVLAVGDAEFQARCLGKMKDVAREGRTVLFVSHNMGAVSDLCNRAIYLNKGQVVLDGSTESVIRAYVKNNMLSNISDGAGLDDPTQRRGNGKVRFRRIEVINSEGKTDTEFIPHEKIIFRMEVIKNEPVETIYASVAFRSGRTREIITYTPKFTIPHQQIKPGEPFVFDIIVPDFNLHPGVYETYYWLGFESSETAYDVADNLLPPIVVNLPPGNDRLLGAGYYSLQAEFSMHQLH